MRICSSSLSIDQFLVLLLLPRSNSIFRKERKAFASSFLPENKWNNLKSDYEDPEKQHNNDVMVEH